MTKAPAALVATPPTIPAAVVPAAAINPPANPPVATVATAPTTAPRNPAPFANPATADPNAANLLIFTSGLTPLCGYSF